MTQSKQGKKGFQKMPLHLQRIERYNYKMTTAELKAINDYCKAKDITKSKLFQTALSDFYESNGIIIEHKEDNNPNQLRIDD
tara:strand:- start:164 stop:409 length:246 start_codon:yes stop_codon:yes gene_type:complete